MAALEIMDLLGGAKLLVKDCMVIDLVTMETTDSVRKAKMILDAHGFRHLPIVDNGEIVGIVSDRDINRAMAISESMMTLLDVDTGNTLNLGEIMVKDITSVCKEDRLKTAAQIMLEKKISCLPVIEGDVLVGLLTETDILKQFIKMPG